MSILDPLAPYLGLIRIALLAALVGGAFLGGCSRGKAVQHAADQARLNRAASALRDASTALSVSAATLREVDRQTLAAKAAADRLAKVAREAVAGAERDAEVYADQIAAAERELARAKRDPACKQALEAASCAVFR